MYGNAKALSEIFALAGNTEKSKLYKSKSDTIQQLIQTKLWSNKLNFFETMRMDVNSFEWFNGCCWYFLAYASQMRFGLATIVEPQRFFSTFWYDYGRTPTP